MREQSAPLALYFISTSGPSSSVTVCDRVRSVENDHAD